jgi:O-antigen/teichoic acid export membrane protein
MTTKVVKGSLWTLAGQVAPLAVSLVTTPFVIRMLGPESYGVLILVGLIPTYLGFADFGMGLASTKFASEAYAEGDPAKEARIVRTAAVIALCSSVPIAATLVVFSAQLISLFNVSEHFHAEASLALKIAAATFVITFLNGIFNTPQLARLRMDLSTLVNSGSRILGLAATVVVVLNGGGVVEIVLCLAIASFAALIGHLVISQRLVKFLYELSIDPKSFWPMFVFGGNLFLSFIATSVLAHSEKLILPWLLSVRELAFYSVAFTLASMATLLSAAFQQSLIPAFSQLSSTDREPQLLALFARSVRINALVLIPLLIALTLFAKPFFTFWAGTEFGQKSTSPFFILILGLLLNILASCPYSLLLATGRSQLFAKIYWLEALAYIPVTILLISNFGIVGAAISWTVRVVVDAGILFRVSSKIFRVSTASLFPFSVFAIGIITFGPSLLALLVLGLESSVLWVLTLIGVFLYCYFAWNKSLTSEERVWLNSRLHTYIPRARPN